MVTNETAVPPEQGHGRRPNQAEIIVTPDRLQGDPEEALRFLRAVFRGNPSGHLALSAITPQEQVLTWWGSPVEPEQMVSSILDCVRDKCNIYTTVTLQDAWAIKRKAQAVEEARAAEEGRQAEEIPPRRLRYWRAKAETALALPGLFCDFDIAGPAHKAGNLPPSREAVLDLLRECPFEPTLVVNSGHGLQPWWLFEECLSLERDGVRDRLETLSQRWQAWWRLQAAERGWTLDATHDFARLLRLPGTYNLKPNLDPVPVRLEEMDESRRYRLADFTPYLAALERPTERRSRGPRASRPSRVGGAAPVADEYLPSHIEPIMAGCAWMRHCRDDGATLAQPEWYRMLSITSRCADGERISHDMSRPYAAYDRVETQETLERARCFPTTCDYVATSLTAGEHCNNCPNRGKVRSPIQLGETEPKVIFIDDIEEEMNHQTECEEENEEAQGESRREEESPPRSDKRVLTHEQARRFEYPEWSWEGIYRVRADSILFSPTSHGKTTIASGLVVAKLFERPFLGRSVKPGSVFYWAAEDFVGVRERIDAYLLHYGLDWKDRKHELTYLREGDIFTNQKVRDYLARVLRSCEEQPNMFILDNLGCCFGGGEMVAQPDMTTYWDSIKDFRRQLGWNDFEFLTITHSAVGSVRPFGSSVSDNRIDAGCRLEKHDRSDRVTVHSFKQRQGKQFAPFDLMFVDVPGSEQGVLVPYVEDRSPFGVAFTWIQLLVQEQQLLRVAYRDGKGGPWQQSLFARAAELDPEQGDTRRALDKLVANGSLKTWKAGRSRYYEITDKGRELYEGREVR